MAKQKIDLRSYNKKAEQFNKVDQLKPVEVDVPGVKGTLPFNIGRQNYGAALSREAKAEIAKEEAKYLNEVDVIPENVRKNALAAADIKVVDFDDLPEEKKEELKGVIKEASKTGMISKNYTQPFIPRGPGILEAVKLAEKVAHQPEKPSKPVEEKPVTAVTVTKCNHCGWNSDIVDNIKPTSIDKQNFVATILSQKRFTKEYSLLGDKVKVIFRTLTVNENDAVLKQLMKDWNDGKISGPAHSIAEATKYQMVLSLFSIDTAVGAITLPEFNDYDQLMGEGEVTIVPSVVSYIYDKALPTESVRRIVGKAYGSFMDTVSKLEVMAETPDFWQVIAD